LIHIHKEAATCNSWSHTILASK